MLLSSYSGSWLGDSHWSCYLVPLVAIENAQLFVLKVIIYVKRRGTVLLPVVTLLEIRANQFDWKETMI